MLAGAKDFPQAGLGSIRECLPWDRCSGADPRAKRLSADWRLVFWLLPLVLTVLSATRSRLALRSS